MRYTITAGERERGIYAFDIATNGNLHIKTTILYTNAYKHNYTHTKVFTHTRIYVYF